MSHLSKPPQPELTARYSSRNLSVLMALDGEPGWVCLMCCNSDSQSSPVPSSPPKLTPSHPTTVLFSAVVIQWVTSRDSTSSNDSFTHSQQQPPPPHPGGGGHNRHSANGHNLSVTTNAAGDVGDELGQLRSVHRSSRGPVVAEKAASSTPTQHHHEHEHEGCHCDEDADARSIDSEDARSRCCCRAGANTTNNGTVSSTEAIVGAAAEMGGGGGVFDGYGGGGGRPFSVSAVGDGGGGHEEGVVTPPSRGGGKPGGGGTAASEVRVFVNYGSSLSSYSRGDGNGEGVRLGNSIVIGVGRADEGDEMGLDEEAGRERARHSGWRIGGGEGL